MTIEWQVTKRVTRKQTYIIWFPANYDFGRICLYRLDNGISSFPFSFYFTQEQCFNGVNLPNYEEIGILKRMCKCACHYVTKNID